MVLLRIDGIMECWKNGILGRKADDVLILLSDEEYPKKIRYPSIKPRIPAFHYSNIPLHLTTPKP